MGLLRWLLAIFLAIITCFIIFATENIALIMFITAGLAGYFFVNIIYLSKTNVFANKISGAVDENRASAVTNGLKKIQVKFVHLEGIDSFCKESEVRIDLLDEALSFEELDRINPSAPFATASLPYNRITNANIIESKSTDHLVINYISEDGENKKLVLDATQEAERYLFLRILKQHIAPTKPPHTNL